MLSRAYELKKTQYPNGDIFYGILVESLRTGFGELRTKEGDILKGQWKMDRLNGVGKISYSNGREFIGSFIEGVKHGIGKLTIGQKSYKGEFKDGKRTGYGEFNESNFEIRKGKFENGEHNNYGEIELKNTGNVYKGYFKNGKPNGPGIETTDEEEFTGEYQNGKKHGFGKIIEKSGFTFAGSFKFGEKTGFGLDKSPEGDSYAGELLRGRKNGNGRLIGPNFNYTGGFRDNEYSGFGRIQTKEMVYIGEWKESREVGLGYYKDLTSNWTYFGSWENGKRNGVGYESLPGEDYKGEFRAGKRHGRGFLKSGNQDLQAVQYEKGKVVALLDHRNLHDLKIQFSQLKIDQFFKNSRERLVKVDHVINENLKKLEINTAFNFTLFNHDKNQLQRKLNESFTRFENLCATYDKLNRKFTRDMQMEGDFVTHRSRPRDPYSVMEDNIVNEDEDEMLEFMMGKSRSLSRSRGSLGGIGKTRGMISITNLSKMKIEEKDLNMRYQPIDTNERLKITADLLKEENLGPQMDGSLEKFNFDIVEKKFLGDNSFDLLKANLHQELSFNSTSKSPVAPKDDIIGGDDGTHNSMNDIPWDSMRSTKGKKLSPQEPSLIKLIGNESSLDPLSKDKSISRSRINEFFMNDSEVGPLAKEFSMEMKNINGEKPSANISKDLEFGLSQLDSLAEELRKERSKEKYYMQRLGKDYSGFNDEKILEEEDEPETKDHEIEKLNEEQRKLQERLEEVKRKKEDIESKRMQYLELKMNSQRAADDMRRKELRRQREQRRQRSVELRKRHEDLLRQQEDRRRRRLEDIKKRRGQEEVKEIQAEDLGLGLPPIDEDEYTTLNNRSTGEIYTPIQTNNPYKLDSTDQKNEIENTPISDLIKVDGFDPNNDYIQAPLSPDIPDTDMKSVSLSEEGDKENESPRNLTEEKEDIVYLNDLNSPYKPSELEESEAKSVPKEHQMSSDTGSMVNNLKFEPQGLLRKKTEPESPWKPKGTMLGLRKKRRKMKGKNNFSKRHKRNYESNDELDVEFYKSLDKSRDDGSGSKDRNKYDSSLEDTGSRFFSDRNTLTIRQLGSTLRRENKMRETPSKNLRAHQFDKRSDKKSSKVKKRRKKLKSSAKKGKRRARTKERPRKGNKIDFDAGPFERRRKKKVRKVKGGKRAKTKERRAIGSGRKKSLGRLRKMAKNTSREENGTLFENRYQNLN